MLTASSLTAYLLNQYPESSTAHADHQSPPSTHSDSADTVYSKQEVAKHRDPTKSVWVTYNGSVYDVTDFIQQHPGGASKILLAAGADVGPFWALYKQHEKSNVQDILRQYKIGVLSSEDTASNKAAADSSDPYANEPDRHPSLVVVSSKPFNAETPTAALDTYITPNELFYVRNHLMTPRVDADSYKLTVCPTAESAASSRCKSYSLDDIKSHFKPHTITSTIQCAGNRRHEQVEIKPVKGLDWAVGAIATAEWTGVHLRDVLQDAGVDVDSVLNDTATDSPEATKQPQHIQCEALDIDPSNQTGYGASIPIDKACDPRGDVILAYEMNGQTLPADHGFPLRVVAPGIVGARNVKWVHRIIASPEESQSHWQQKDYKGFSPSTDWDTVDWQSAPAIQEVPVTSVIVQHSHQHSTLSEHDDEITVKGYAYAGGGRDIARVDVSADGGKTWQIAQLRKSAADVDAERRGSDIEAAKQTPTRPRNRAWAWTLWEATLPVDMKQVIAQGNKSLDVCCKAVDNQYNVQPDSVQGVWTLRGVLNNAWHRIKIPIGDENEKLRQDAQTLQQKASQDK